MSSKTTPTTHNAVLLALTSFGLVAAAAIGIGAQSAEPNGGADREPNFHSIQGRGDITFLPAPLQNRLVELARRPHSYLPLTVFGEADAPSQLFATSKPLCTSPSTFAAGTRQSSNSSTALV